MPPRRRYGNVFSKSRVSMSFPVMNTSQGWSFPSDFRGARSLQLVGKPFLAIAENSGRDVRCHQFADVPSANGDPRASSWSYPNAPVVQQSPTLAGTGLSHSGAFILPLSTEEDLDTMFSAPHWAACLNPKPIGTRQVISNRFIRPDLNIEHCTLKLK